MSYVELDVLRQNIYTPLTLLVFAGLVALETRRTAGLTARLLWGALLGISAAAFYLTREESVWVLPGAALLIAVGIWNWWREPRSRRGFFGQAVMAIVCAAAVVLAICTLNFRYYGWFGTVELRAREFLSAYGALQRSVASEEIPYVPVTREMRMRLYDVSPSFGELRPCLEGPVGLEWANYSDYLTGRPAEELQIGGGSFMWALRDCVIASGHGGSAREALQFYRSIAKEINRACDEGRAKPCRSRRDTLLPRSRSGEMERLVKTFPGYAADFFLFRGFTAYPTESWGSADLLGLFRDLTRWRLAPSTEAPEFDLPVSPNDRYRLQILELIGVSFRWLCVATVMSGGVAWIWAFYRRRISYLFLVSTAAFGSALVVLALNMLVHVLAFRNQGPTALHQGYPLLLLFGVTAWAVVAASREKIHGRQPNPP
jgi:4-amino-4-deoxy-L-arabinose transferase-like glycosyltransferase